MKIYKIVSFFIATSAYGFSAHNLHQFMWANIDSFAQKKHRALQRYQQGAAESVWSYHGYIPFLFDHNKYSTIVSLAPKIDAHFADNPQLQLLLALSFKKLNDHSEGNKRIAALSLTFPTNANIMLRAAQSHIELREHDKALTILDTYLNKSPYKTNSFLFYFLKGQIYAQLKENSKALVNIQKCLEVQPGYSQAWLIRAILEEQRGHIENAIAGYSTFLTLINNPESPIHQHLLKLVMQKNLISKSSAASMADNYESPLDSAIICFTKNQHHQALMACNKYLQMHPGSIKAKLLKVQILTAQKNIQDAIALLRKEIESAPTNDIWYKTLYHLKKKAEGQGDFELVFKNIAKQYPTNLTAQLYAADIVLRSTQPINALPYLLKAELLATLPDQKIAILYQQALLYYDTHGIHDAQIALKKLIQLSADHAPAHNLLAYITAKQGLYDAAHRLIDKALLADPDNYHYRDTKGYIFYKEKNYAQAEKIFTEIAPRCPHDITVLTHLKKTYNKQNKAEHEHQLIKKITALNSQHTDRQIGQKKI